MITKKINITEETIEIQDERFINLIEEAKKAVHNAYAPYSKFQVGSAVLLENGKIITGTNQENAAYPSGICAERVAVFQANSLYPNTAVIAIAVAAYTSGKYVKSPIAPCGSCRQVLLETELRFNKNIHIFLYGENEAFHINSASELLPVQFNAASLNDF